MYNNNKAIGPVIASGLLLVVAIVSVVTFQTWFNSYSSDIFSDVETQSGDSVSSSNIDTIIDGNLYFKNSGTQNITISSIKVGSVDCNVSQSLGPGVSSIDVSSCVNGTSGSNEVVVITNQKVFSKKLYLTNQITSSSSNSSSGNVSLTFSTNTSYIYNGSNVTLTWSTVNATSCTGSDSWSGSKGTSGSESVNPTENSTYTLTCDSVSTSLNISVFEYSICVVDNVYYTTGGLQSFTVPVGCSELQVKLWGAGGGGGSSSTGGAGGFTYGNISVSEGETYYILVGGYGIGGTSGVQSSASGGGLTGLFYPTYNHSNSVLIAGGGGGGNGNEFNSYHSNGGAGGGLVGEYGDHYSGARLTTGGSQVEDNGTLPSGAIYGNAFNGTDGQDYNNGIGGGKAGGYGGGGDGADGTGASYTTINSGGGGGGYYGGASGDGSWYMGGGGGSGFINHSKVISAITLTGIYRIPAGISDLDYVSSRAYGGTSYASGQNGVAVIKSDVNISYSSLNFQVNSSVINPNSSINLSWSSSYLDTCLASGDWSGSKELTGYEIIENITESQSFSLNCYSGLDNITKTVTVSTNNCETNSTIFEYTGSIQYLDLSSSFCNIAYIQIWGAGGGKYSTVGNYGGAGGYSEGYINLSSIDTLAIIVGEGGKNVSDDNAFGGGGAGADRYGIGSGGGGLSGIFNTSYTFGNSILIAGGGGGASSEYYGGYQGGYGGGLNGGDGVGYTPYDYPGLGASQVAGGAGGTGRTTSGSAGSTLIGGDANDPDSDAGGGGGGYYGGGGGGGYYSSGGGGSGYNGSSIIINSTMEIPSPVYTAPNSEALPDGYSGIGDGGFISYGGNGLVVITLLN